jgi:hypothetical protein
MVLNDHFIIACKKSPQLKSSQNMHFVRKFYSLLSINHEDLSDVWSVALLNCFRLVLTGKVLLIYCLGIKYEKKCWNYLIDMNTTYIQQVSKSNPWSIINSDSPLKLLNFWET